MSLYPSLEDMKASEVIQAQIGAATASASASGGGGAGGGNFYPAIHGSNGSSFNGDQTLVATAANYPRLHDFMGLELTEEMIRLNMPEYLDKNGQQQVATMASRQLATGGAAANLANAIIAPISGSLPSQITHTIRRTALAKPNSGTKLGLRVRSMQTGVFICLVIENSPAAAAGLRFGDQILQINGNDVVGMDVSKVHSLLKQVGGLELIVRDRPFERTLTLIRDSTGHIGFQFKNGKIINIVQDSSAARNGLLTQHHLLEINQRNVVGMKDKEISKVIEQCGGNSLVITVMPSFIYEHMVKEMDKSLFGKMDHSNGEEL